MPIATTKLTAFDKVLAYAESNGFADITEESNARIWVTQTNVINDGRVLSFNGLYQHKGTVQVRVEFKASGAFLRYRLTTPGVDWSGFPNTLTALIENDSYGKPLLHDIAPPLVAAREDRQRRSYAEKNERQAQAYWDKAEAAIEAHRVARAQLVEHLWPLFDTDNNEAQARRFTLAFIAERSDVIAAFVRTADSAEAAKRFAR